MNVIVNYPKKNSMAEKQLLENIAKFHAKLIKESVDMMNLDSNSKNKILEQILEKYNSD